MGTSLSIQTLLLVFGGGILGAAWGPLWSIILCAFIILSWNRRNFSGRI